MRPGVRSVCARAAAAPAGLRRGRGGVPPERRARRCGRGRRMSETATAATRPGPPPEGQGTRLLDVRDLVVTYPVRRGIAGALRREPRGAVRAVDGVSFSVRKGEML